MDTLHLGTFALVLDSVLMLRCINLARFHLQSITIASALMGMMAHYARGPSPIAPKPASLATVFHKMDAMNASATLGTEARIVAGSKHAKHSAVCMAPALMQMENLAVYARRVLLARNAMLGLILVFPHLVNQACASPYPIPISSASAHQIGKGNYAKRY